MNTSGENLIQKDIEQEMKDAYLDYSMSVIASRALPDVRDGLKPVHRTDPVHHVRKRTVPGEDVPQVR